MSYKIYFTLFILILAPYKSLALSMQNIEFMKRTQALYKFEEQLLSSLSVPHALQFNESPRKKWLNVPDFVRRRLMAPTEIVEYSDTETKEIFIPVNFDTCNLKEIRGRYICISFNRLQSTIQQPITSTFLFLDLPNNSLNNSTYFIQDHRKSTNNTLPFTKLNDNLLKVNIYEWVTQQRNNVRHDNHQFVVRCTEECDRNVLEESQLFLEVVLGPKVISRRKRSLPSANKSCTNDDIMCCKRSFIFRPIDIGLGWIVSPREIRLNYCMGECNDQTSNISYSQVMSMIKRSKNINLTPQQWESMKFCCAPKKYIGIDVIYLTNNNNTFQKLHLNNMIVDSCSCI
uniref:Inhibin-1 n=1 Tax=Dendrocoelum lacteum TaxID=27895 RepID=T1D136_9PLAT